MNGKFNLRMDTIRAFFFPKSGHSPPLARLDFKAKKAYAGVDCESIKDKYENIRETFVSHLPTQTGSENCAHSRDFFTTERIASKMKQIRAKYGKALDAGGRSGVGRIVATFYDLCNGIYSGWFRNCGKLKNTCR